MARHRPGGLRQKLVGRHYLTDKLTLLFFCTLKNQSCCLALGIKFLCLLMKNIFFCIEGSIIFTQYLVETLAQKLILLNSILFAL